MLGLNPGQIWDALTTRLEFIITLRMVTCER